MKLLYKLPYADKVAILVLSKEGKISLKSPLDVFTVRSGLYNCFECECRFSKAFYRD